MTNTPLNLLVAGLTRRQPPRQHRQLGFSYIEVMVALVFLAIAIVPAMEGIQSGIQGAGIHTALTRQHYALISRMEQLQAEDYTNLLAAAKTAGNATTPSSYSDPGGQAERVLVYLALYDADIDPFTLVDPDNDADANIYTGDTSNLLWLKVELEKSIQSMQTLVTR